MIVFGITIFIPSFMDNIKADDVTYTQVDLPGGLTSKTTGTGVFNIVEMVLYHFGDYMDLGIEDPYLEE